MSDYMVDETTGSETARYSAAAAAFHWVSAALVIAQIWVGLQFADMPKGPDRMALFGWHKLLGVVILLVVLLRLAQRLINPPPPYPSDTPRWDRAVAVWTHRLFYFILIVLPLTGLILVSKGGKPIDIMGLFSLPALPLPHALGEPHEVIAKVTIGLLVLHIAGALYHQLRKDGAAGRMPPFSRG